MANDQRTSDSFSRNQDNDSGLSTFKAPPPTPTGTAALIFNTYRYLGTSLTYRLLDVQEQRDADKATESALACYNPGMLTNRTNLSTATNYGHEKDDLEEEWWTESRSLFPIHLDRSIKQALNTTNQDRSIVQYPAPERSQNRDDFYHRLQSIAMPTIATLGVNLSGQTRHGSISPYTADGDVQSATTGQSLKVFGSETTDEEVIDASEELDDGDDALRALTKRAFIDITQFARDILDNDASETHGI
ncbi:hypothetical protein EJ07DRAFT_184840 [Lizonia empirigonia]|nr:hypothetical protein EJ07DRAFT_184840 [Lizonia empirigonia]